MKITEPVATPTKINSTAQSPLHDRTPPSAVLASMRLFTLAHDLTLAILNRKLDSLRTFQFERLAGGRERHRYARPMPLDLPSFQYQIKPLTLPF